MRIFFITSKLNFKTSGGSVVETDFMMRELQRLGNEVTAVTFFSYMNDIEEPRPYNVIEEQVTARRLLNIQWKVFKILKKYESQADIFHIDGHLMLYGAGFYRFVGGQVPVFAYFNRELLVFGQNLSYGFHKRRSPLIEFFLSLKVRVRFLVEKFILMQFAKNIDYSSYLNPILCQEYYNFGLTSAKNGLIIGDPYPKDEVMKQNNLTESYYTNRVRRDDKIVLFYSGRMAPGKGYDLLIKGFAEVKDKSKFRLILGGSGPEENLVKKMIKDLNLESYVELPGWVPKEDLYKNLKQADIYIFTRWRRDLSSVALTEVLVFGIPSIVPAGGGLAWVAGKGALTFVPEDPNDLAKKIEELGSNIERREKLSKECYLRLKEPDLDPSQTIPAMNVIMRSLVFRPK